AQALAQGLEGDLLELDWTRRQFGEGGRAVWDVDVDEVLGVKCVDLALAGSHDGWGEDGEGQEVETEVPRAAEAGLYTGEDKGRLCALVHAQLVRAQHADAAPGAGESERLCKWSPSCAVHCCPI
ncbi:hypothetical protein POSPLADRAFT_1136774, partial [Postia placenta MAD-698-R-SB12]